MNLSKFWIKDISKISFYAILNSQLVKKKAAKILTDHLVVWIEVSVSIKLFLNYLIPLAIKLRKLKKICRF